MVSPVLEILLPSKTAKFPFRGMDYSPWSSKNLIDRNRLKKIMQVGINIKCMHTSFGWVWSLQFQRYCYLSKTAKFPFWGMDYSPWSLKKLINRNRLKNIMQVGVNVTCMYISFGGRGLSGFGNMATFQKRPNFPFGAWTIVHGHQKIELIRIGSKNSCK